MTRVLKRARYVLRSILIFLTEFKYSLLATCIVISIQLGAKVDREILKENLGIEVAYFISMARKWVNDTLGFYLVMAVLVLVVIWIVFHEYKNFVEKEP